MKLVLICLLLLPVSYAWTPPIGIPAPAFGIEESHTMYNDPAKRNPALTYTMTADGPCTHTSIPNPVPEGSVVCLNNPITANGVAINSNGNAARPVFVRGPTSGKTLITITSSSGFSVSGSYTIVENLHIVNGGVALRGSDQSMRYSDVGPHSGGVGSITVSGGTRIVFYSNKIHENGGTDRHGFYAGAGSSYSWVVDNDIYGNSGDGVQFCHACPESSTPQYVYIGRNIIHDNTENAVDFKTAKNVVVSQNVMYGHRDSGGSDGTAFVVGSNGLEDAAVNIWGIFNDIHDNNKGIRIEAAANDQSAKGPAYFIGNKIHDIAATAFNFEKDGDPIYIVGNTVYNADSALDADWIDRFNLRVYNLREPWRHPIRRTHTYRT